ncbi:TPA: Kanadaptin [Trebouxia sp. C0004]
MLKRISITLCQMLCACLAGSDLTHPEIKASADSAPLENQLASKAGCSDQLTTPDQALKGADPLQSGLTAAAFTRASAAAAAQLDPKPPSQLGQTHRRVHGQLQPAADMHVVGEELDARAFSTHQQIGAGAPVASLPTDRQGSNSQPADEHVVGEEQDARSSGAATAVAGGPLSVTVSPSSLENSAGKETRRADTGLGRSTGISGSNALAPGSELSAGQQGYARQQNSQAVGQSVDVEDGEMPDDDPGENGQKLPAQAVINEEVHPRASTAHFPLDRHPGAPDTVGQDGLPDHAVGEEIQPRGSTAGFQSDGKRSGTPPSDTQHRRPSEGAVIGGELDERAVHGDVVMQARHPKRRHTDSSYHNSRTRAAFASESSEGHSPSLHVSPATEKHEAQWQRKGKAAALPESAETGHRSNRSTRKASAAQQQGTLEDQAQLSRGSPASALEVGAHPIQQLSAGCSSSDSGSDASASHPLPLPSWRQQEQLEPEEEASRAEAKPSAQQGPSGAPAECAVSPNQRHCKDRHRSSHDGRRTSSASAPGDRLQASPDHDTQRHNCLARHGTLDRHQQPYTNDHHIHGLGHSQHRQATSRKRQYPSGAEDDGHRYRPDHQPGLNRHPAQELSRSAQQPRRPFTREATPSGHPASGQGPFRHDFRGQTPPAYQDRRQDLPRDQYPPGSRGSSGALPARGGTHPPGGRHGVQARPGGDPHLAAATHRHSDRTGGYDRGHDSQGQLQRYGRMTRHDTHGNAQLDRRGREADRPESANRRGHNGNGMASPPPEHGGMAEEAGVSDRQSGGYHAARVQDSRGVPRDPIAHVRSDRRSEGERAIHGSRPIREGRSSRSERQSQGDQLGRSDRSFPGEMPVPEGRPSGYERHHSKGERHASRDTTHRQGDERHPPGDDRHPSRDRRPPPRHERQSRGGSRSYRSSSPDRDHAERRKVTGFGGEATPAVAGDPTSAAAAVMRMQGHPTGTGLTLEQKKSKLWGSKAATEQPQADAGYGVNRWDTAAFSSETDKEKFSRLMGVKRTAAATSASQHAANSEDRELFSRERQDRVMGDLESQFITGLKRKDGRTVGLGL